MAREREDGVRRDEEGAQHGGAAQREAGQGEALGRPSLTLKKRIKASPAAVFAAWTQPALMAHWFGPHFTRCESAEADPRVGGRFRVVMREVEGETAGERHEVSGRYLEVLPGERLVFTWAWVSTPERESLVTVTFKALPGDAGEECLLTLLHERFFDEAARDGHGRGWRESLERLERLFG